MVYGLHKLAIAKYSTAGEIQITAYLYHYVNLVGIAYGFKQDGFIRVVVGIGRVNIGNQSHLAVGTLNVGPVIELLTWHAQKV